MPARRGFALIELMVVLAVLVIVAVVALPSFQGRAVRANRIAAETVLRQIVQQQDLWYAERRTYAPNLSQLGYPADAIYVGSDGVPGAGATNESTYRIHLAAPGGSDFEHCSLNPALAAPTRFAYVIVAEPQGYQAISDIACGMVCQYSTGQRGARADAAPTASEKDCWTR